VLRERLMTFTSFSGGFMSAITKPKPELIGPAPVNHLRGGRSFPGQACRSAGRPHRGVGFGTRRPVPMPDEPARLIAPRHMVPGTPVALMVTSRLPDWIAIVNPKLLPVVVPPPPRDTTAPP
jgi:hypothetical protein